MENYGTVETSQWLFEMVEYNNWHISKKIHERKKIFDHLSLEWSLKLQRHQTTQESYVHMLYKYIYIYTEKKLAMEKCCKSFYGNESHQQTNDSWFLRSLQNALMLRTELCNRRLCVVMISVSLLDSIPDRSTVRQLLSIESFDDTSGRIAFGSSQRRSMEEGKLPEPKVWGSKTMVPGHMPQWIPEMLWLI